MTTASLQKNPVRDAGSRLEVVNAISRGNRIEFIRPGGESLFVPATYDYFLKTSNGWDRRRCSTWSQRSDELVHHAKQNVTTYEGDVNAIRRHFVDNPDWTIAKPYACYFDLEADSRCTFFQHTTGQSRVLCWTTKGKETGKVCHEMLQSDSDADERVLLAKLWNVLSHYDQLLGWNSGSVDSDILRSDQAKHGFDFYVLIRRSEKLGVLPKWWRRLVFTDHLAVFKRNNMNSGDASEKTSFSLESIGMAKCGRGKTDFDSSRTWEAWVAGGTQRARLGEYNVADVELECDIEKATDYLSVFQSLCQLTQVFPDTPGLQPMRQVDGLMLRYGNERGVHFKTKDHSAIDPTQTFAGAYCDGPYVNGMTKDVHVADFKALYPSIMISLNISPELLGQPGVTCPVDQESLTAYGINKPITFGNEVEGILPACVKDMLMLREEWKQRAKKFAKGSPEEQEASRKSMAYKMASNGFMGVSCSPYSRYSTVEIGLAITRTGVALIKAAREACTNRGWKVIYIDTDSLFVTGPTVDEFKDFTQQCNSELFPKLASDWGCKTNAFYLDYEKAFEKVLFTYDVKEKKYNRKKYAYRLAHKGFTAPKVGSEIDVVGIEYKRGDSSGLARQLQKSVVDHLLGPDAPNADTVARLIEPFRIKVFHEPHTVDEVSITKAIHKDLDSYKQNAPHITAAKMMRARGQEVRDGTKIRFVVVSDENRSGVQRVVLAEDYKGDFDRSWFWQQVYAATHRIVAAAFPGDVRFDKYATVTKYEKAEAKGQMRLAI